MSKTTSIRGGKVISVDQLPDNIPKKGEVTNVVLSREETAFAVRAYLRQRYALHKNLKIVVDDYALPQTFNVGVHHV